MVEMAPRLEKYQSQVLQVKNYDFFDLDQSEERIRYQAAQLAANSEPSKNNEQELQIAFEADAQREKPGLHRKGTLQNSEDGDHEAN